MPTINGFTVSTSEIKVLKVLKKANDKKHVQGRELANFLNKKPADRYIYDQACTTLQEKGIIYGYIGGPSYDDVTLNAAGIDIIKDRGNLLIRDILVSASGGILGFIGGLIAAFLSIAYKWFI